jgi:hypothetical protein
MNAVFLLQGAAASSTQLHTARWLAGALFVGVLVALGSGLWRAKRRLALHEADALLDADFRRLERGDIGQEP